MDILGCTCFTGELLRSPLGHHLNLLKSAVPIQVSSMLMMVFLLKSTSSRVLANCCRSILFFSEFPYQDIYWILLYLRSSSLIITSYSTHFFTSMPFSSFRCACSQPTLLMCKSWSITSWMSLANSYLALSLSYFSLANSLMCFGFFRSFDIKVFTTPGQMPYSLATTSNGIHLNLTFSTISIFSVRLSAPLVLVFLLNAFAVGSMNSFGPLSRTVGSWESKILLISTSLDLDVSASNGYSKHKSYECYAFPYNSSTWAKCYFSSAYLSSM